MDCEFLKFNRKCGAGGKEHFVSKEAVFTRGQLIVSPIAKVRVHADWEKNPFARKIHFYPGNVLVVQRIDALSILRQNKQANGCSPFVNPTPS